MYDFSVSIYKIYPIGVGISYVCLWLMVIKLRKKKNTPGLKLLSIACPMLVITSIYTVSRTQGIFEFSFDPYFDAVSMMSQTMGVPKPPAWHKIGYYLIYMLNLTSAVIAGFGFLSEAKRLTTEARDKLHPSMPANGAE